MEFLGDVYASTRSDLSILPWSSEQKVEFCRSQFIAQHQHYQRQFADAQFDVVMVDNQAVGRIYVDNNENECRVIEMTILPEFQKRGIATALMTEILDAADTMRKPVRLRVEHNNPARHWYKRLGFRKIADEQINWHMERPVSG